MTDTLPLILAGPILRHTTSSQVTLWLCTSRRSHIQVQLHQPDNTVQTFNPTQHQLPAGERCYLQLLHLKLSTPLPEGEPIGYELIFNGEKIALRERLSELCYADEPRPSFIIQPKLKRLLHGSCRKPHHPGEDGLCDADRLMAQTRGNTQQTPALLLMTGDQVYADDVAGPMLAAIHQLIAKLGLRDESFSGATVDDTQSLFSCDNNYYEREQLLPRNKANRDLLELFFGGAEKPIFTSAGAHNHLISLSEMLAMYLLTWSPICWTLVNVQQPPGGMKDQYREQYLNELKHINHFADGLGQVQRLMAHLPSYMIFDDHDVTDDWNLTRGWEETAYGHPFSRRIIGNALIAYWLCQGWGNQPEVFKPLASRLDSLFADEAINRQDELIDTLLDWEHWHYELDTQPPVVVLDTRTRRWRSESSPNRPSGLMDWEALTDMQQKLIGHKSVIMVSPSPVFGVKLIEVVQRIFTFFGKALMVDAENWMAHPGAANVMLNIFSHLKTPPHFIILSGDVHYSFVYDVTIRRRKHSPEITQITASGLKNTFPASLLKWFDRLNRWLYASRSPLNLFTKRRRMKVRQRHVPGQKHDRLLNQCGIGLVELQSEGDHIKASIISRNRQQDFY
ncbi:alkaline phosphatase family protein [Gilvimarinus sp. DA14]|uniref:alkaline phosphatase family protein n=1 Tax=Gilvimarinus sp. DA14 TaxID=2956798 RepID=UPI0020B6BDFB|nr:alkaline phosphatase family protein [Gilvimarinus sp. DA14]UTF61443.1 alkaline phosphatase family protein [Gilvimarinus sp. DA14]